MIVVSIVTGTLNRRHVLEGLIQNTVDAWVGIELVLVDGGSTDGTLEFLRDLKHPRIKLIEIGHRSPYWHYMNEGVKASTYEYVCQWNDDVLMVNSWESVFEEVKNCDASLFAWQYGDLGDHFPTSWNLCCYFDGPGLVHGVGNEIVMNYGIYKKEVFRKAGLYNDAYYYYCADGDMSFRAWAFGFEVKPFPDIKVISLLSERDNKKAINRPDDLSVYIKNLNQYRKKEMPSNIEFLK
jgi:glycosyltransferase involved in cell wall biosynthesis